MVISKILPSLTVYFHEEHFNGKHNPQLQSNPRMDQTSKR
jgi:hypothetical protein